MPHKACIEQVGVSIDLGIFFYEIPVTFTAPESQNKVERTHSCVIS